jgi:hypothetical protein
VTVHMVDPLRVAIDRLTTPDLVSFISMRGLDAMPVDKVVDSRLEISLCLIERECSKCP